MLARQPDASERSHRMTWSRRLRSRTRVPFLVALASLGAACEGKAAEPAYAVTAQHLPGAGAAGISMDYIAFDPATHSLWVPAGNTGAVDVVDTRDGSVRQISGLATAEVTSGERKRVVGPSSVSVGDGWAYVGNRGDSSVCAFDQRTLARGACHKLDAMPDAVVYVAPTKEVWVTTPRDHSIHVLDAAKLEEKAKLSFEGSPEGYSVDAHRFYTNLEDKDRTLAIDLQTRKTAATWKPNCGEDGPRGLRADAAAGQLFVACTGRVEVLDVAHDGAVLSSLDTGDGVDDFDYVPAKHLLYVGAAKAGRLTVARVDAHGKLSVVSTVATPQGARNPVVGDDGVVYLAHTQAFGALSDLAVVSPAKK
jgi:DNA-binding beta-propeller fold protein YncE